MTENVSAPEVNLTSREYRFIEFYLQSWNATEACRKAGYKWPNKVQYQIIRKPKIKEAIAERMKSLAMDTDEILYRLSQQAKASVAEFFDFEEKVDPKTGVTETRAVPNWDRIKEFGYLIKKVELTREGWKIELNDPQNALIQLGRAKKLFVDRTELDLEKSLKAYIGISPDDWDDEESG